MKRISRSDVDRVIELLRAGWTGPKVAAETGVCAPSVYMIARRHGIKMDAHKLSDEQRREAVAMAEDGYTQSQIAKAFGVDRHVIATAFAASGYDYKPKDTEESARRNIEDTSPGFEYVDGYKSYKSRVRIRCKTCGFVIERSYDRLIDRASVCPNCNTHECARCGKMTSRPVYCSDECQYKAEKAKEKEKRHSDPDRIRRREERMAEAEHKRQEVEASKVAKLKAKLHPCAVCGELTMRPVYCSNDCAKRAENKRRETARRAKISDAIVDKDITLEGVWRNGLGVCYICGCVCDWNDKTEKDGTIICGDTYPSIDHYIPLSKGGEHSWKNCVLACRKCNSIKSDHLPPSGPNKRWGSGANGGNHLQSRGISQKEGHFL